MVCWSGELASWSSCVAPGCLLNGSDGVLEGWSAAVREAMLQNSMTPTLPSSKGAKSCALQAVFDGSRCVSWGRVFQGGGENGVEGRFRVRGPEMAGMRGGEMRR